MQPLTQLHVCPIIFAHTQTLFVAEVTLTSLLALRDELQFNDIEIIMAQNRTPEEETQLTRLRDVAKTAGVELVVVEETGGGYVISARTATDALICAAKKAYTHTINLDAGLVVQIEGVQSTLTSTDADIIRLSETGRGYVPRIVRLDRLPVFRGTVVLKLDFLRTATYPDEIPDHERFLANSSTILAPAIFDYPTKRETSATGAVTQAVQVYYAKSLPPSAPQKLLDEVAALEAACELDAANADALFQLGQAYTIQNRMQDAHTAFGRRVAIATGSEHDRYTSMIKMAKIDPNPNNAFGLLMGALASCHHRFEAITGVTAMLNTAGRFIDSFLLGLQIMESDPRIPDVAEMRSDCIINNLSYAAMALGQYSTAHRWLCRAVNTRRHFQVSDSVRILHMRALRFRAYEILHPELVHAEAPTSSIRCICLRNPAFTDQAGLEMRNLDLLRDTFQMMEVHHEHSILSFGILGHMLGCAGIRTKQDITAPILCTSSSWVLTDARSFEDDLTELCNFRPDVDLLVLNRLNATCADKGDGLDVHMPHDARRLGANDEANVPYFITLPPSSQPVVTSPVILTPRAQLKLIEGADRSNVFSVAFYDTVLCVPTGRIDTKWYSPWGCATERGWMQIVGTSQTAPPPNSMEQADKVPYKGRRHKRQRVEEGHISA